MAFQFLCPQGHLLQGEEAHMGMQCQCPQCGMAFIIPTIQRPPQPAPAPKPAAADPFDLMSLDQGEPLADLGVGLGSPGGAVPAAGAAELDARELIEAIAEEKLLHIPCPNGHELDTPLDMIGKRAMCPHCGAKFRLRREKSIEHRRELEIRDRKRAQFWMRAAIVTAGVVGLALILMVLTMIFS